MKVQHLLKSYSNQLKNLYPHQEAESLVYWLFEHFLGLKRTEISQGDRSVEIPSALDRARLKLLEGMPIQYITGKAPFYGREFTVNPSVLIPRNETEELVHLIIKENKIPGLKIMDIGTGSGCIPITLSLEMERPQIAALDLSGAALRTARLNAETFQTPIDFYQLDILADDLPLSNLDILVSNPPYVMESEKRVMHQNVLNHEPHLALFVPDEDPLLFYKVIASKGKESLQGGGKLYFEINEALGKEVGEILANLGYADIKLIKDLNDRDRIMVAMKK